MKAEDVKELLTTEDIIDLLYELGAEPIRKGDEINCRTICHNGHKHKLVYYTEAKTFSCFTDSCGKGMDIFVLVGKVFGCDFPSSFRYICGKFGIRGDGIHLSADHVDTKFIRKFRKKEPQHVLSAIPTKLLNSFWNIHHKLWIDDGISRKTMSKFNILFSIRENKIIIPHFDLEDRLLGIRGRALNQEEVDAGKKYMPVFLKGEVRKHPTGGNIYGLNRTKKDVLRHKTIILFESEKAVMQLDTMLPEMSIGGAISGSSLTNEQVKILHSLGIEHVVLALDREFTGKDDEIFYKQKIMSGFVNKLIPYFRVSVMWDSEQILDLKDAPTDKGVEVFLQLWRNKIYI